MLANLKSFVKRNQDDVFVIIAISLVALFSFGLGRLTVSQKSQEPIIIQNPEYSASVQGLVEDEPKEQGIEQGKLVGSVNSNKYHWPDCPWAKKIAPENQIWFESEEEAQSRGYVPCQSFDKYAPNNN